MLHKTYVYNTSRSKNSDIGNCPFWAVGSYKGKSILALDLLYINMYDKKMFQFMIDRSVVNMDVFEANVVALNAAKQIYVIHLDENGKGATELDVINELAQYLLEFVNKKKQVEEIHEATECDHGGDEDQVLNLDRCLAFCLVYYTARF